MLLADEFLRRRLNFLVRQTKQIWCIRALLPPQGNETEEVASKCGFVNRCSQGSSICSVVRLQDRTTSSHRKGTKVIHE